MKMADLASPARKLWIFDLDNTLHDASAHIFPHINRAMTSYIMQHLQMEQDAAHALRQHYWNVYGATLKGLIRHHGVNGSHFLRNTHIFENLPEMVVVADRLRHTLRALPGRKMVFTNAPIHYASAVLDAIGISSLFEHIYSVESTRYHPKPSMRGFRGLLRVLKHPASDCIMVEDSLPALRTAKRLGMQTVWVTPTLQKPCYVDARVNDVLALPRLAL